MKKIIAYLKLMRPANLLTAVADILVGFAASGSVHQFHIGSDVQIEMLQVPSLLWLMLSTVGLYGGGVVFNDLLDMKTDVLERPERPLPSGSATKRGAMLLGLLLLAIGVYTAYQVSIISMLIAAVIVFLSFTYNGYSKRNAVLGPLNMGLCRAGNLLLGISAIPASLDTLWFMAAIPIIYIAAITIVSRGEVSGMEVKPMQGAGVLYLLVIIALTSLAILPDYDAYVALPFVLLFCLSVFPSLYKALKNRDSWSIRKAVSTGVLSLIILDASVAAGFAGFEYGIMVLFLLPLSKYIAKNFAVT